MVTIKQKLTLQSQFIYTFGASRGFQYKPFYNIHVPARVLIKVLRIDDIGSTMDRSQRLVNKKRANEFADYLIANLENSTPYIIPTVTGFIDDAKAQGHTTFVSAGEQCDLVNITNSFNSVGVLVTSMDAEFKLFDGQTRSTGIMYALDRISKNPEKYPKIDLSTVSIPVMAYLNLTLEERQTFFADINLNMSKPQASIGIAYDHRDALSRFAVELAQELPFKGLVELERNTVSKKSDKLFPLKTIKDFAMLCMGLTKNYNQSDVTTEQKAFVRLVLNQFSRSMGWAALEFDGLASELRETSIITHTVMLKAIAIAAKTIDANNPMFEGMDFSPLSKLDYSREGGDFLNRCIDPLTLKMRMNQTGITLTANKLVSALGGKLTGPESILENTYFPLELDLNPAPTNEDAELVTEVAQPVTEVEQPTEDPLNPALDLDALAKDIAANNEITQPAATEVTETTTEVAPTKAKAKATRKPAAKTRAKAAAKSLTSKEKGKLSLVVKSIGDGLCMPDQIERVALEIESTILKLAKAKKLVKPIDKLDADLNRIADEVSLEEAWSNIESSKARGKYLTALFAA